MSITLEVIPHGTSTLTAFPPKTVTLSTKAGGGEDKSFIFMQGTPAAQWCILHPLNKYPSVTVVDSAGSVVIGEVQFISKSEIRLSFEASFSGRAFLN